MYPEEQAPEQNILERIVAQKRQDLLLRRAYRPLSELQKALAKKNRRPVRSLQAALQRPGVNIIAEIKRCSPSKGPLRPELDPVDLAGEYLQAGASAISVLTEERFFGGQDADLQNVHKLYEIALLRKDFVIDPYQIWESKLLGASAILLIAAALSEQELISFAALAEELELDVLFEVHDEAELTKVMTAKPRIIGVNNRDLKTFQVDRQASLSLIAKHASTQALWVSESGIHEAEHIKELYAAGFRGFLIGESLLRAASPAKKLAELCLALS